MRRASIGSLALVLLAACGSGQHAGGSASGAPSAGDPSNGAPPSGSASPPSSPPSPPASTAAFHFFAASGTNEVTSIVYGDQAIVRLTGVDPGAHVTIRGRSYDTFTTGYYYESHADFVADATGAIDCGTMAPADGTYAGADPDGLFWSMAHESGSITLGSDKYAAYFTAEIGGQPVAQGSLTRTETGADVTMTNVSDNGLVGAYFAPKGATGKVPILAFGGSEGGIWSGEDFAARFAAWGHPALGVAYFGATGLPQQLENIPLEYFDKAMTWLSARPEAVPDKVIVVGISRGGELALLLGATFPKVSGVVAFVPSAYVWGAAGTTQDLPAWTYKGVALPGVPSSANAQVGTLTAPDGSQATSETPWFQGCLKDATPAQLDAAAIAVEKIGGPVLAMGGGADAMWPSCDFVDDVQQRLGKNGHTSQHGDEFHCFADAGHDIGFAGGPTTGSAFYQASYGWEALGGTAVGIAHAQRAGDTAVQAFLEKNAP